MMKPLQTWIDGEVHKGDTIQIPLDSGSLTYGLGLFETMALRDGRILCWDLHAARVARGAKTLGFDVPRGDQLAYTFRRLPGLDPSQDRRLRLRLLHRSESSRPILIVQTFPYPDRNRAPVNLFVSDAERSVPPGQSRVKVTSYFEEWLVTKEAGERGLFDGLFTYRGRWLSEGSRSNLFFLEDGLVRTPGDECGLLPGVGREAVLQGAGKRGVRIETGLYEIDRLGTADDIAVVSALRGVMPVGRVVDNDGASLWERGDRTGSELSELLSGFYDAVALETSLDLSNGVR